MSVGTYSVSIIKIEELFGGFIYNGEKTVGFIRPRKFGDEVIQSFFDKLRGKGMFKNKLAIWNEVAE